MNAKTPICDACKKKNYTKEACREQSKHRRLPYCTSFVTIRHNTSGNYNNQPQNVVSNPQQQNQIAKYAAQGQSSDYRDEVIDPLEKLTDAGTDFFAQMNESRTMLCIVSSRKTTYEWVCVQYENECFPNIKRKISESPIVYPAMESRDNWSLWPHYHPHPTASAFGYGYHPWSHYTAAPPQMSPYRQVISQGHPINSQSFNGHQGLGLHTNLHSYYGRPSPGISRNPQPFYGIRPSPAPVASMSAAAFQNQPAEDPQSTDTVGTTPSKKKLMDRSPLIPQNVISTVADSTQKQLAFRQPYSQPVINMIETPSQKQYPVDTYPIPRIVPSMDAQPSLEKLYGPSATNIGATTSRKRSIKGNRAIQTIGKSVIDGSKNRSGKQSIDCRKPGFCSVSHYREQSINDTQTPQLVISKVAGSSQLQSPRDAAKIVAESLISLSSSPEYKWTKNDNRKHAGVAQTLISLSSSAPDKPSEKDRRLEITEYLKLAT